MIPILFALVSFVGWGVGDIFGTIVSRRMGALSITFWSAVFGLFITGIFVPFTLKDLSNLTVDIFLLNLLLSVLLIISMFLFYKALSNGSAALVGVISAAGFGLVPIFSINFLGESINTSQVWAIVAIFLGVFLVIYDFKEIRKRNFALSKGILFALVTMLIWGVYYSFIKIPISQVGWFWPNYLYCILSPLILVFMRFQKVKLEIPTTKQLIWPLILTSTLLGLAELSYNFALGKGLAAVVGPISGSYPVLFVVLAFLIFKDPITRQQIAGIITTLIGIVLLSFLSV